MAKVNAPFLSMTATGTIGKTLVSGTWKGIKYMRQHVVPSNPKSTKQTTQRTYMALTVAFWRSGFEDSTAVPGWNLYAANQSKALSGFNLFASSVLGQLVANNGVGYTVENLTSDTVYANGSLRPIGPGTPEQYTGNAVLKHGESPTTMFNAVALEVTSGQFTGDGDFIGDYCQIFLPDGTPVSGIQVLVNPEA